MNCHDTDRRAKMYVPTWPQLRLWKGEDIINGSLMPGS